MSQIGYFAAIIPAHNYYQGVFLDDRLEQVARAGLDRIRAAPEVPDVLMHVKLGDEDHLDPVQAMIGATSASLAECALKSDHLRVGVLGYVLHILTGYKYFTVTMHDRTFKGTTTSVVTLPGVSTIDAARSAIERLPSVLAIKVKLLGELDKHIHSAPH